MSSIRDGEVLVAKNYWLEDEGLELFLEEIMEATGANTLRSIMVVESEVQEGVVSNIVVMKQEAPSVIDCFEKNTPIDYGFYARRNADGVFEVRDIINKIPLQKDEFVAARLVEKNGLLHEHDARVIICRLIDEVAPRMLRAIPVSPDTDTDSDFASWHNITVEKAKISAIKKWLKDNMEREYYDLQDENGILKVTPISFLGDYCLSTLFVTFSHNHHRLC